MELYRGVSGHLPLTGVGLQTLDDTNQYIILKSTLFSIAKFMVIEANTPSRYGRQLQAKVLNLPPLEGFFNWKI